MKLKILCALSIPFSLFANPEISLQSSDYQAGYATFQYAQYPGRVSFGNGQAFSINLQDNIGRFFFGTRGQFIKVKVKSVTVAGQNQNWGNEVDGFYTGAFTGYNIVNKGGFILYPEIAIGYQNFLGGSLALSVGFGFKQYLSKNFYLSGAFEERYLSDSKYEGITFKKDNASLFSFGFGIDF